MNEQIELNVLTMCRVCLQDDNAEEEMLPIFQAPPAICEKIEECSGLKIQDELGLPSRICPQCRIFLQIAYKFRVICRNSERYLREFVLCSKDGYVESIPEYLNDFEIPPETLQASQPAEAEHMGSLENGDTAEHVTAANYSEVWDEIDEVGEEEAEEEGGDEAEVEDNDEEDEAYFEDRLSARNQSSPVPMKISRNLEISPDGAAVIRIKSVPLEPERGKPLHICDICGNTYPRKYALEAHMRRHRNEKPFECEICQAKFHMNFQLTRHIRKHIGLRPHTCQYCSRTFGDRSTLVKHERIHRNERPYACETCGKTFTYSSVLKVHKLTHSGEKPFHCGICGKRFGRAHHLRAHLETQQHLKDPRAKVLLQHIRREEEDNQHITGHNETV